MGIMHSSPRLQRIAARIAEAVHPTKIILFGSRARNTHRRDSDYDLVVVYDGPKGKRELDIEIQKLFHPPEFSLDVFVFSSEELERAKHVANSLEREVFEKGVVLYG